MRDRVVIDTSVWVAALKSAGGASRQLIRLCMLQELQPLVGQKLLAEYEDVMGRAGLFRKSPLSETERSELLDAFLSVSVWIPVFFLWRPNLPDEGDNHVIELAVAGAATKLITHNLRDFQRGELKFPMLEIITPADFLNQWSP
ncbi:MAG TPA: putative toxin-antitoxin system toxin component, PIN family [Tepidisphaeraceae bacterium]|nr:putative toxin-antitoxin system toxin component, PIN family [Tepidisphaeraceae bacterium]